MEATYRKKALSISRLHLDTQNPRVGRGVTSEDEALQRLLDGFGKEILALARDIAGHGLDPTQSWAVVKEGNRFVVQEGNRRLVACRLLTDPGKAPTGRWQRSFQRINVTIDPDEFSRPSCIVFNRRADGRHWMQIKHYGAQNGTGTARWGPEMVYLDSIANGGSKERWQEFWFWLEDTYSVDPELSGLVSQARKDQYTTMERVYDWALHIKLNASIDSTGTFVCPIDPDKIRLFVYVLMKAMTVNGDCFRVDGIDTELPSVSSRSINDQESAERVINVLWEHAVGDQDVSAQSSNGANTPEAGDSNDSSSNQNNNNNHPENPNKSDERGSHNPRPSKAETHLYAGVRARSKLPGRLKNLLVECSKIEIEKSPETASVMARIAIELTADALIKKRSINVPKKKNEPTLYEKLKAVLYYLDPTYDSTHPEVPELRGVWAAIRTGDHDSGHLVKDLNDSVHEYTFTATLDIARRANNMLTPLIAAMIKDLREK